MKFTLILLICLPLIETHAQERVVRIGINYVSPPFCFISSGQDTVGVDREIGVRVANALKAKPVFVKVSGAAYREQALDSGEVDLIIAAFSITAERKKKIWFSHPYHKVDRGLAILTHPETGVENLLDLKDKRYGFVLGSTADAYVCDALKWKIKRGTKGLGIAIGVPDQEHLMSMFFSGELDAIVDDVALINYWNKYYPEYKIVWTGEKPPPPDRYGVAVSRNGHFIADTAIINSVITELTSKKETMACLIEKNNNIPPLDFHHKRKNYAVIIGIFLVFPLSGLIFLIVSNKNKRGEDKPPMRRPPPADQPVNYCWIIANSEYEEYPGLNDHPYNDADNLKAALVKYGFEPHDIAVQYNVTRKTLLKTFQDLASRLPNKDIDFIPVIRPIDNLLIYYSGHGYMQKLGSASIGFWTPVDGAAPWELIPDYEIKFFLNLIGLNQILLISDSCFSGALLNVEATHVDDGAINFNQQACIEILASGNNRVPDESEFLKHLIEILENNPKRTILSHEIYESLKTRLGSNRYYQPQFGSLRKSSEGARFHFNKPVVAEEHEATPELIENLKSAILNLFHSEGLRLITYAVLRKKSGIEDNLLMLALEVLVKENKVHLTEDNSVFILKNTAI